MSDALLPVFSFRPNWREPMVERLSFLTDVIGTDKGVEQRRALRNTPRRAYDADFLLTEEERTFWDLYIDRLGGQEMTAPIYWEVVSIPAALTASVSDRIDFDTTRRDWAYHTGYLAILTGRTALDYEVVEIASVDDNGVNLVEPPARSWPKGTKLYPLRRAVLEEVGEVRQPSAAVGAVAARLRIVGPNPWVPAEDTSPIYGGLPVLLSEPNWVEDLAVMQDRKLDLLDTGVGRTYQVDATGRVMLGQSHRWFLPGKDKIAEFRDLIYRHNGRQGGFWLPTFKADLKLAAPVLSTATQITVKNVGYGYTGGVRSGREYIAIKHGSGTIIRRILSVIPGTTPATERLNLDAPVGLALSPGQVRRISFADTARFDSDEFEITHYAGVEGHHECQTMFRAFKNTRTTPSPIRYPIPTESKNNLPCGVGLGEATAYNKLAVLFGDQSGSLIVNVPADGHLIITKPRAASSGGALLYDAWSAWGNDAGTAAFPSPIPGQTWDNGFIVYASNGGAETPIYDPRNQGLSPWLYATADQAFDALSVILPVSFTGYTQYRITNYTDPNPSDNRGGISLMIQVGS